MVGAWCLSSAKRFVFMVTCNEVDVYARGRGHRMIKIGKTCIIHPITLVTISSILNGWYLVGIILSTFLMQDMVNRTRVEGGGYSEHDIIT